MAPAARSKAIYSNFFPYFFLTEKEKNLARAGFQTLMSVRLMESARRSQDQPMRSSGRPYAIAFLHLSPFSDWLGVR